MYYCPTFVQIFILRAGGDHRHLLCYFCSGLYHPCRGREPPSSFAQTVPTSTVYIFTYTPGSTISVPHTLAWPELDTILCGATSTSCHNIYLYYYGLIRSSSSIQRERIADNISIDNSYLSSLLFYVYPRLVPDNVNLRLSLWKTRSLSTHTFLSIRSNLLNPLIPVCERLFIHQSTVPLQIVDEVTQQVTYVWYIIHVIHCPYPLMYIRPLHQLVNSIFWNESILRDIAIWMSVAGCCGRETGGLSQGGETYHDRGKT